MRSQHTLFSFLDLVAGVTGCWYNFMRKVKNKYTEWVLWYGDVFCLLLNKEVCLKIINFVLNYSNSSDSCLEVKIG